MERSLNLKKKGWFLTCLGKNLWNFSTKTCGCQKFLCMDEFSDEKATQSLVCVELVYGSGSALCLEIGRVLGEEASSTLITFLLFSWTLLLGTCGRGLWVQPFLGVCTTRSLLPNGFRPSCYLNC